MVFFISSFSFAVVEENQQEKTLLKAQIMEIIKVGETKNIQARFTDLKDKALEIGVDNIFINGKIFYTPNGNYQNLKFNWESLENNNNLSKTNYAGLKQNFHSNITTNEEKLLPPTEITLEVDEDILMSAIKTLMEKNNKKNEVKLDEEQVEEIAKQPNQAQGFASSNNSNLPTADFNAQQKEDVEVSIVEKECPVRYDVDLLRAFEQKSINKVDSNGNTLDVGPCLDSGTTYDLKKTYGSPCSPLIGESKVFQSYRITGVVAGEDKIIRDCQVDLEENSIAIQTTTDSCNYEHHLDLGLSYQTQRKFYELNGEIINISQCESNKKPYQHTQEVCSYDLEIADGFAVPQVKTYITLDDGSQSIVKNCTTSNEQLAVIEKECTGSDRYYHDFNASTSYLQKEKWVKNPYDNNNEVKVNSCDISETTFTHLQKADNCARTFEDHNLLTRQSVKTYIDDSSQNPSEIFISECSNGYFDIPYTISTVTLSADGNTKTRNYIRQDGTLYQRIENTTSQTLNLTSTIKTWEVPTNIEKIHITLFGGNGDCIDSGGVTGHAVRIEHNNESLMSAGVYHYISENCRGLVIPAEIKSKVLKVTPGEVLFIKQGQSKHWIYDRETFIHQLLSRAGTDYNPYAKVQIKY